MKSTKAHCTVKEPYQLGRKIILPLSNLIPNSKRGLLLTILGEFLNDAKNWIFEFKVVKESHGLFIKSLLTSKTKKMSPWTPSKGWKNNFIAAMDK